MDSPFKSNHKTLVFQRIRTVSRDFESTRSPFRPELDALTSSRALISFSVSASVRLEHMGTCRLCDRDLCVGRARRVTQCVTSLVKLSPMTRSAFKRREGRVMVPGDWAGIGTPASCACGTPRTRHPRRTRRPVDPGPAQRCPPVGGPCVQTDSKRCNLLHARATSTLVNRE